MKKVSMILKAKCPRSWVLVLAAVFVTADVTGLYPNITHETGL